MLVVVGGFFGEAGPVASFPGGRLPPDAPTRADIVVQPLSASQWRVCDRRLPDHDARSLLGFIEMKGGQYEVMELVHGFQWFYFGSLRAATDHFAAGSTETVGPTKKARAGE